LWKLVVAVRPEGLLGRSSILWASGIAGSLPPTPLDFRPTIAASTASQPALWGGLPSPWTPPFSRWFFG
jgi:hypothetical protein